MMFVGSNHHERTDMDVTETTSQVDAACKIISRLTGRHPLPWVEVDKDQNITFVLDFVPWRVEGTTRSGGSTLISLIYSMGPIIRSEWVAQVDPGESVGDAIQRVARYVGQQFGLAASDANKLGATQSSS
jgi:hypothetical protein